MKLLRAWRYTWSRLPFGAHAAWVVTNRGRKANDTSSYCHRQAQGVNWPTPQSPVPRGHSMAHLWWCQEIGVVQRMSVSRQGSWTRIVLRVPVGAVIAGG